MNKSLELTFYERDYLNDQYIYGKMLTMLITGEMQIQPLVTGDDTPTRMSTVKVGEHGQWNSCTAGHREAGTTIF